MALLFSTSPSARALQEAGESPERRVRGHTMERQRLMVQLGGSREELRKLAVE